MHFKKRECVWDETHISGNTLVYVNDSVPGACLTRSMDDPPPPLHVRGATVMLPARSRRHFESRSLTASVPLPRHARSPGVFTRVVEP